MYAIINFFRPGSKALKSLPENFTPDMVPENAKETCRNWFYKIASIRELVPRLYVEMAIIKSYGYLTTSEYSTALLRITRMIRGIGNPLIAVYARCYLCRVGLALNKTSDYEFVRENFNDFLLTYQQLFGCSVRAEIGRQNLSLHSYLNLYTPALDWILQVMAKTASENLLVEVLSKSKQQAHSGLLLNAILVAFKPAYIAARSMEFVDLIAECEDEDGTQKKIHSMHSFHFFVEFFCLKRMSRQNSFQSKLSAVTIFERGKQTKTKNCVFFLFHSQALEKYI